MNENNKNRYEIIPIKIKHRARFGIWDNMTRTIIEDANGWGFKSKETALKFLNKKYLNKKNEN